MPTLKLRSLLCSSLALVLALQDAATAGAGALQQIGVAAAVRGNVSALAPNPGAVGRVVESGRALYLNDKISTGPEGRLQIMLLDETIFTIGPNSSLVLDEFVYDPKTDSGKVTASITKGIFRFVTGKIAKRDPSEMKVRLPMGTIGIRGTIVTGYVGRNDKGRIEALAALMGPGPKTNALGERIGSIALISKSGKELHITRPGFAARWEAGSEPGAPFPASREIAVISRQLAPRDIPRIPSRGRDIPNMGQMSGQNTASGLDNLAFIVSNQALDSLLAPQADLVAQGLGTGGNLVPDGLSTWDDIISNIPSGVGNYNASGNFNLATCNGSVCGAPSGMWGFGMTVDFGAKTILASYGLTGTANFGAFNVNDSNANIGISFAGLKGPASFTDTHPVNGPGSAPGNVTYTFQFQNANGITANQLQGNVVYSNLAPLNAGNGVPLTATRQ